jgi:hypothetical protein
MFQTNVEGKIKMHILNLKLFFKSCRLRDNVEKYRKPGQDTDDNIAQALCMLDK